MLYMVFFGEIFSICALTCTGLDRKFPYNYALLAMFTFCISWIVGIVCMHVRYPVIVFEAVGLTAAMVVGLTFYAITTKHDFTMCGGVCWVLFLVLAIASLMCFVMGPAMHLAYCCIGVLLYSIFLIQDVQMIVGGKHRRC